MRRHDEQSQGLRIGARQVKQVTEKRGLPAAGNGLQPAREKVRRSRPHLHRGLYGGREAAGKRALSQQLSDGRPHERFEADKGTPGRARQAHDQRLLVARDGDPAARIGGNAAKQEIQPRRRPWPAPQNRAGRVPRRRE